ncbi:MAG: oligosaccharide flippase family protein [Clostridium sp.]|nr:MAG: oligosaccharide flippase family protein [Clostridium sp.]
MTEGVIWKQILAFALPMLLSNVIQRLYNAVDSIVVGRFVGHEALAAVGSNNSIINVFVSLFLGISVGAGVVVAQYYGAKDDEKLKKSVQTCAFLAIVSGIVLTIGGYFLAEPILKLVHTPENVMALSREYLQIYFLGVLGALIYNMGSGVILAVGDSKRPFVFAVRVLLEYRAGRSVRKESQDGRCGRGMGDSYFAIRIGDSGHVKASSDKTEL